MAINNTMPSINNFLSGFSNGLPGMKDFRHASRLYIDDNQRLAPKQKWLFHTVFEIDNTVPARPFTGAQQSEINMLVKSCELPKYDMNLEEKQQYNKKVYIGTRIKYSPVSITFHDDQADIINAFWKSYYEYHIADSLTVANLGGSNGFTDDDMYKPYPIATQFGMDNAVERKKPFLKSISIFLLHKKQFTSFKLINPIIGSFSHDTLDQTDGAGILTNTMQIFYETVLYGAGSIKTELKGKFADLHYDFEPSPLSVLGRGTTSIFGAGGILDGVSSAITNYQEGNVFGAVLGAINTYNNAKKIKAKDAVKEELKGIVKDGIIGIGESARSISTAPMGNYIIGAVAATAAVASLTGAVKLGNNTTNSNVISNPVIDTITYLTATESFNLVQNNTLAKDKIAVGIYYKSIGSRKGLSIAESEIEFIASSDAVKNVYRSRVLSDVGTLVNNGYIKINRATNEININAERALI